LLCFAIVPFYSYKQLWVILCRFCSSWNARDGVRKFCNFLLSNIAAFVFRVSTGCGINVFTKISHLSLHMLKPVVLSPDSPPPPPHSTEHATCSVKNGARVSCHHYAPLCSLLLTTLYCTPSAQPNRQRLPPPLQPPLLSNRW
jgi:hypothetical protein